MWFQGIAALVLLGIAGVFLDNARCKSMPATVHDALIGVFVAAFVMFVIFILRERPKDEREAMHAMDSGRAAYVAGLMTMATGIVVQTINHQTDPWLVFGAGIMIFTKIASLIYNKYKM